MAACGDDGGEGDGNGGCENGHDICIPDAGETPDADPSAPDADPNAPIVRTKDVIVIADEETVAGATITLTIDPEAETVTTDVTAKELVSGDVYTVWWAFFNNPENCENPALGAMCSPGDLMVEGVNAGFGYAGPAPDGGGTADENGDITWTGLTKPLRAEGDVDDDFLIGNGLRDLLGAEIHVVLRTHGEELTGELLDSQLGTFNGGCLEGEPNEGECANTHVSFFDPVE